MRTLEEIKEKYASEIGYEDWESMYAECLVTGIDAHINEVANRYASKYQERIKELEDAMILFVYRVEKGEVRSLKTYEQFKKLLNKK